MSFVNDISCLLIIKTLIHNNCNVWQPPVAKHCPIIPLLLTTTNPHPAAATTTVAPCECPHRPSEGMLIANAHIAHCATSLAPTPTTSPYIDSPPHSPLPLLRDVGEQHLPCHCPRQTPMPRHPCQWWPLKATSPPTMPAMSLTTNAHWMPCHHD